MISIVLCTYNGSRYIEEQLNSYLKQTVLPDELIVCDDNSTDNTLDRVRRWRETVSFPVYIVKNPMQLGITKNFENGIRKAKGDYIFLSDQDDVWLSCKLEDSLQRMQQLEQQYGKETPLLVHSDLTTVDTSLQVIHDSMFRSQRMVPIEGDRAWQRLLVQNFVTGCTILINRATAIKALPFPPHIVIHDWWLATVVALIGHIGFVSKSTIYYRQHGDNSIGSRDYYSLFNLKRLFSRAKLAQVVQKMLTHNQSVAEFKQGLLLKNPVVRKTIEAIRHKRLLYLYRNDIKKEGFTKNIVFYIGLLLAKTK